MPQFVRQHRFHLIGLHIFEQRVVKHNAFIRTQAREISIAVAGALAAVHHKNAFALKARAREQIFNLRFQTAFGQRLEFIE